jgi:chromosome segregation ATPase
MEHRILPDVHEQLPEEPCASDIDADSQAEKILHIVQDLRRRLRHSDELASALHAELDTARSRYEEVQLVASTRAREIDRLMVELQEARDECARLLAALSAANDERTEAILEIHRLNQELVDSQDTVRHLQDEARDQAKAANDTVQSAASKADGLATALEEARQTIQKLEDRLEKRTRQFDEAMATNEDISREVDHLREEIVLLERSRLALRKIHHTLADPDRSISDEARVGPR